MDVKDDGTSLVTELVRLAARAEQAETELAAMKARILPFWAEEGYRTEMSDHEGYLDHLRRHAAIAIGREIFAHERGVAEVQKHGPEASRIRYRVDVLLTPSSPTVGDR